MSVFRRRSVEEPPDANLPRRRGAARPLPGENATAVAGKPPPPGFLRREPVLDTQLRIVGYRFCLGAPDTTGAATEQLLGEIIHSDLSRLLWHRRIFLPIDQAHAANPLLLALPADGCIPNIVVSDRSAESDDELLAAQAATLRAAGYTLGLKGKWSLPLNRRLLAVASYCFIDAGCYEPEPTARVAAALAKEFPALKLVVGSLATGSQYERYRECGAHLFHGSFIVDYRWRQSDAGVGAAQAFALVNELMQEANPATIAAALKRSPILSQQLLRQLSTSAAGGGTVASIEDALLLLGRDKLYRWVAGALLGAIAQRQGATATFELALARGRLMELAAQQRLAKEHHDRVFVTGLLSLLDRMLGAPLPALLKELNLPEAVSDALLTGRGLYAGYLGLAAACDTGDEANLSGAAARYGLSPQQINALHLQALAWAQEARA